MPCLRGWRSLFLALSCLSVAGCITKNVTGDKTVYTYELWVPIGTALAGVAALVGGLLFFKYNLPRGRAINERAARAFVSLAMVTFILPPVLWVVAWSLVGDTLTVENTQFNLY